MRVKVLLVRSLAVPRQPGTLSRQMGVTTTKIHKQEKDLVGTVIFSKMKAERTKIVDKSSWDGILSSSVG